jgi:ELWxxDGT repeat protein
LVALAHRLRRRLTSAGKTGVRSNPSPAAAPASAPLAPERLESRRLLSATLVKDINTLPNGVAPSPVLSIGNVGLFANSSVSRDVELWRTDGTAAGTGPLADLMPGIYGSHLHDFMRAGDLGFFGAGRGGLGFDDELWRSDGTAAGTSRVLNTNPGGNDYAKPLAAVGNRLFFTADDSLDHYKLWVTDGTPAGTHVVSNLPAGVTFAGAQGDRLIFQAFGEPDVLYATDGTDSGTAAIPAARVAAPGFIRAGSVTYFADTVGSLWRTDGTPGGTAKLPERLWPASTSGTIRSAVGTADGAVFFDVLATGTPARLYRYQPATGLTLVTRDAGLPAGGYAGLNAVGSTVYFAGAANPPGSPPSVGVYRVDPGATTAVRVPGVQTFDTNPASRPGLFTYAGGALYFVAFGNVWKIESPEAGGAGARLGTVPTDTSSAFAVGGLFGALANDPQLGWALYKSDGTAAGTGLMADVSRQTFGSLPANLTPFNGKYLFTAIETYVGTSDRTPWITDGTEAGTFRLAFTGSGGNAFPWEFAAAGSHAFFATHSGAAQLWVTDGTPAGTHVVRTIDPIHATPRIHSITASPRPGEEGVVYFSASDQTDAGSEMWRSDGTEAGTYMVKDIRPATPAGNGSDPQELTPLPDGTMLFTADDGVHGRELWQTDGTTEGTHRFEDVAPGIGGIGFPPRLTRIGNYVYFAGRGTTGRAVWRTDGTRAGTAKFADGAAPSLYSEPGHAFVEYKGSIYFQDPQNNLQLWRSDGTPGGTVVVASFQAGDQPLHLRVVGDKLYFTINDGQRPTANLWTTDGTPAGTRPVMISSIQPPFKRIDEVTVVNGQLFFRATPGNDFQSKLYTSDGSEFGTVVVDGPNGTAFHVTGGPVGLPDGSILAPADDGTVGEELFRFANPGPARLVGRHVFYNHSGFDGGNAGIDAADDAAIATDKAALLPGGAASFANVTGFDKGINGVMIDVANGPGTYETVYSLYNSLGLKFGAGGDPSAWADAPRPEGLAFFRGGGVDGSDRYSLTWPDGTFRNGWLRVAVPFGSRDVFYFGNLVGETGDGGGAAGWRVSALDLGKVKRDLNGTAGITSTTDVNRDGRVNALDLGIMKRALNLSLAPPFAPTPAVAAQAVPPAPLFSDGDAKSARLLDELLA